MKTTQTFGVRFIALPKKSRPDDAFIYVRITVSKKVIDISLKKNSSVFFMGFKTGIWLSYMQCGKCSSR